MKTSLSNADVQGSDEQFSNDEHSFLQSFICLSKYASHQSSGRRLNTKTHELSIGVYQRVSSGGGGHSGK